MHAMLMEQHYKEEIAKSVANSMIYSPWALPSVPESVPTVMEVSLVNEGSVDAIMRLAHDNMAVLNFASYTHPGGQFLNGSSAQEESLCHESTLYNVLSEFHEYYKENHSTRHNFMYSNRAIYSPDVPLLFCLRRVLARSAACRTPCVVQREYYRWSFR